MTHTALKRRALPLACAALATGGTLSSSPALAASITAAFRGPTLDEGRVVVQVTILVKNKTIIGIRPTVLVRTTRSQFINLQVLPLLKQEVLQVQNGNIQLVSGATVTSQAYRTSLLAAIRKARTAKAL